MNRVADDLISRAAALRCIMESRENIDWGQSDDGDVFLHYTGALYRTMASSDCLPAVDAAPVVYGRWIDENPDDYLDPRMRCSICTAVESPLIKWRYCPNCGAKMETKNE